MRSEAKNLPFYEVAERAQRCIQQGHLIFQKFTCAQCGERQTMPDPNAFYELGRCEECGHITDIVKEGCGFMMVTAGTLN